MNEEGTELLYSTYLGGQSVDIAHAIDSDGNGGVVIVGETSSNNFPVSDGAFDTEYNGGGKDAFVARLNRTGSELIYSTYLGGAGIDIVYAISSSEAGSVVVGGVTSSNNLPVTDGAFDVTISGGGDAFVSRLNAEGNELAYCAYLGGSRGEFISAISSIGGGSVIVVGQTSSNDFPTTESTFDTSFNGGGRDAFVTQLNEEGTRLLYSTYLGGRGYDEARAVMPDGAGGVVVTGWTNVDAGQANDFPTTRGAFDASYNGGYDVFIARFDEAGSEMLYSTYFGGRGFELVYDIAPNGSGGVIIAGETMTFEGDPANDFPTTDGAFDEEGGQGSDGFITNIDIGMPWPGMIFGHVYDLADGSPLNEALIITSTGVTTTTNEDGYWMIERVRPGLLDIQATKTGYNDSTLFRVNYLPGDTLEKNFSLRHPSISLNEERMVTVLHQREAQDLDISIANNGNGQLTVNVRCQTPGDAWSSPWTLRQNIPVSQITGNLLIEGVAFDGESYYCAGSNGNDTNLIYHLDREGALLDSFPQPGHSRYGFKDIEWDGELIWGSGEDTVWAINRNGEVVHHWRAPFNSTANIAYDPQGIVWLSGTMTNIYAYDREGNDLGITINRQEQRIYGLAWFSDDSDFANIYALNRLSPDSSEINKFNPRDNTWQLVRTFGDSTSSLTGAFVSHDFDPYQGWVLMNVADAPTAAGGDRIEVRQLKPNRDWLTVAPGRRVVPAGGSAQVSITLRTIANDGSWEFPLGEYDGEIIFSHNALGGDLALPITLTVIEPNEVSNGTSEIPAVFSLSAPYPNPFNPVTTIRYSLREDTKISLRVFDLAGREVATLASGELQAGQHSAAWNAQGTASGIYLVKLETPAFNATRKVTLVK